MTWVRSVGTVISLKDTTSAATITSTSTSTAAAFSYSRLTG